MTTPTAEHAYLHLMQTILDEGTDRKGRTDTQTRALFGGQLRFDLQDSFPLLTTKKLHLRSIIHELLWFLKGETNIQYLKENKVRIWDEWADEKGELGPVYGKQWRHFGGKEAKEGGGKYEGGVDQIAGLVASLKNDPFSRRHVVSAWNVSELDKMALAPCHLLFQCFVEEKDGKRYLSTQLYQRSADFFLGVPFNIASYALFTLMLAQVCDLQPKTFIHTFGDVHLYHNHFAQAKEQLSREVKDFPRMHLNPDKVCVDDFVYEDFALEGYDPHPLIKAEVSV